MTINDVEIEDQDNGDLTSTIMVRNSKYFIVWNPMGDLFIHLNSIPEMDFRIENGYDVYDQFRHTVIKIYEYISSLY